MGNSLSWPHVLIAVVVGAITLAPLVLAVISISASTALTTMERVLWLVGCVVFTLIGPLAWFVFGRPYTRARGPLLPSPSPPRRP